MVKTVADMLAAAHAVVEQVDIKDVKTMIEAEDALLLDVRDAPEVEKTGLAKGAHHISRGMLEFRADTLTQFHDKELRKDRPIVFYCASGGRAALAC
jgi:rhodanese-related sulfurtransferase